MKIAITENQLHFIRRRHIIKELIDNTLNFLSDEEDACDYTYAEFLGETLWQVSDNMDLLDLNWHVENQIEKVHEWVRDNFEEYIKDNFVRILDELNCGNN